MKFRDLFRFRRERRQPSEAAQRRLAAAIRKEVKRPSKRKRAEFLEALLESNLVLAVNTHPDDVPSVIPAGARTASPVSIKNPDGSHILLAFTSQKEVDAHDPDIGVMELPAGGVFRLMLDGGYSALMLNAAGTAIKLSRADVQALRDRVASD
jgi:hypothetical protein